MLHNPNQFPLSRTLTLMSPLSKCLMMPISFVPYTHTLSKCLTNPISFVIHTHTLSFFFNLLGVEEAGAGVACTFPLGYHTTYHGMEED